MKRHNLIICLLVVSAVLLFLLGGCVTVGPDYSPPELETPARWNAATPGEGKVDPGTGPMLSQWWSCLNDPLLSDLITQTVDNNNDLKEALARVREARARRQISKADRWPVIDGAASENSSKSSENLGGGAHRDVYNAGIDAGWEIDIFGGVRRSIEAAGAELDASLYSYGNVMVSLISEAALNYVEMRIYEMRLDVAEKNLAIQTQTLALARARYEAGLATAIDAGQARTNLEILQAGIPALKTGILQSRNRIAVLMGKFPGSLDVLYAKPGSIPQVPIDIAVGIPAEVLLQRPDVLMAERNLAAQTAKIGVAQAQRYPRMTLSGSIGLDALTPSDLLTKDAQSHGFGPSLSWRIFDAGALRRSVRAQEAIVDQAYYRYQTAMLTAFEDVENALTAFAGDQQRMASLNNAEQSAAASFKLAQDNYASGLIDFQTLLESQKTLLSVEDNLAQSRGAVIADVIRLYKALGGGWASSKPF